MPGEKNGSKDSRSFYKKFIRYLLRGFLLGFLMTLIGTVAVVLITLNDLPPMGEIENPHFDLSTQIFTADGRKLGSLYDKENREYIDLEEMSPWVSKCLLATEDVRFDDHSGIDPKTPFTIIKDLALHFRLRGGSSISQQLARNLYNQVGRANSITRKIKEAIVAVYMEARFTKEEIMQAYLNTTTFYGNTYGVETGAHTLFSKSAADLELHEAALMIGMLKGPTYYNPFRHEERAINRRNTVIDQMIKYNFISEAEGKEVKAMDLGLRYKRGGNTNAIAPYFKKQVKNQLVQIIDDLGLDVDPYTDGLKVYTTLDSRMQKYAEKAVREHLSELQKTFISELNRTGLPWKSDPSILDKAIKDSPRYKSAKSAGQSETEIKMDFRKKIPMTVWTWNGDVDTVMSPQDSIIHYMTFLQTGFLSMDPKNGAIRAWVGGIDFDHFQLDHVTQSARQVGSTFKPIVYGAAMESMHKPCDKVLDIPVNIPLPDGKVWSPKNSGGGDEGLITYYEGLAKSKNQVTAFLMKELGPENVCKFASRMGLNKKLDCVPSLCLGTTDLSVIDMVPIYSTYANYGTRSEPYMIERIEDKNGNVLYEHKPEIKEALDPQVAFTMIRMMQGVVDHPAGTGHRLRTKYKFKNQIAGKTGTTQGNSDGWFMGVTPNLVSGVWVGCDDRRLRFIRTYYGQGANMALPIWAIYMKYVYADKDINLDPISFQPPQNYNEWICEPKMTGPVNGGDTIDIEDPFSR